MEASVTFIGGNRLVHFFFVRGGVGRDRGEKSSLPMPGLVQGPLTLGGRGGATFFGAGKAKRLNRKFIRPSGFGFLG